MTLSRSSSLDSNLSEFVDIEKILLQEHKPVPKITTLTYTEQQQLQRAEKIKRACLFVLTCCGFSLLFSLVSFVVQAVTQANYLNAFVMSAKGSMPWTNPGVVSGKAQLWSAALSVLYLVTFWGIVAAAGVGLAAFAVFAYTHFRHKDLFEKAKEVEKELPKPLLKGTIEFYKAQKATKTNCKTPQPSGLIRADELAQIRTLDKIKRVLRVMMTAALCGIIMPVLSFVALLGMPINYDNPIWILMKGSRSNKPVLASYTAFIGASKQLVSPLLIVNLVFFALFAATAVFGAVIYLYCHLKQASLERKATVEYSPLFQQFLYENNLHHLPKKEQLSSKVHKSFKEYRKQQIRIEKEQLICDRELFLDASSQKQIKGKIERWTHVHQAKEQLETISDKELSAIGTAKTAKRAIKIAAAVATAGLVTGVAGAAIGATEKWNRVAPFEGGAIKNPRWHHAHTFKEFMGPKAFTLLLFTAAMAAILLLLAPLYIYYHYKKEALERKVTAEKSPLFAKFVKEHKLENLEGEQLTCPKLHRIYKSYCKAVQKAELEEDNG